MSSERPSPGRHTLSEILSQPGCWQECLCDMERSGWLDKIREHFDPKAEWLFVGCGSSYCIGLAPDLLIELNLEVPEYARPVAYLLAGQLLGHYTGLRKGMDPDNPRFLSRVAILDERA